MHIAKRLAPFLTIILAFVVSTAPAQTVGGGDWMAPLNNVIWECSFASNPRMRFAADKIETLDNTGKITGTYSKVSVLEPGVLRVDFNSGALMLFVFAEDMQSFVVANMKSIHEFEVEGTTTPSSVPKSPTLIHFKSHPDWKTVRLQPDKLELLDGDGNAYATNDAVPFTPRLLGVRLPSKGRGAVLFSRTNPGGWYLSGLHLGAGVRSEKAGIFRFVIRSRMTGYAARTAHFNYSLLRAGEEELAAAMERQSIWLAQENYGDTSEQTLYVTNEMGTLRGYNRNFERAIELHSQSVVFAKQHFATDKDKLLDVQRDLADAQVRAGLFAPAMETLAALQPLLPPVSDLRTHYMVNSTMAAAAFGLRNYAEAAKLSHANIQRALEAGYSGSLMDSHVELIAAQLAQGQMNEAKATLKTCLIEHKRIIDRKPDTFFDMYEVALACIVLGELEEAKRLARVSNRTTSLTYEEFVHMLAVFAAGERAQAQTLAKQFLARLSGGDDITVRRDVDSMLRGVLLTIADPVPAKATALGQLWGQQVETLKKRPLQNYLFARVMVSTLEALKKAK